jgi:hypothetical protein
MAGLSYNALNDELAKRVPELANAVARLRQQWDDEPGPHVVFGDLLVPYLEKAARAQARPPGVAAALELLEDMITTFDDDEIRNVAGASVLEPLSGNPEAWSALRPLMGPHTCRLADQLEGKA